MADKNVLAAAAVSCMVISRGGEEDRRGRDSCGRGLAGLAPATFQRSFVELTDT
jgi:hypothetical protein